MEKSAVEILLSTFSECLIHIINYPGINPTRNNLVPWILSQYVMFLKPDDRQGSRAAVPTSRNSTELQHILRLLICFRACLCETQLYVHPPLDKSSQFLDRANKLVIPPEYVNPLLSQPGLYALHSLVQSRQSYHILIARELSLVSAWTLSISRTLSSYSNTRIFIVRTFTANDTISSVSVGSRWFTKTDKTRPFFEIPVSDIFTQKFLELSYQKFNFPYSNHWEVRKGYSKITSKSEEIEAQDDFVLFEALIHNLTLIKVSHGYCSEKEMLAWECDELLLLPTVNLDETQSLTFFRHSDEFTFLACGETFSSKLSFWGFISAFDRYTWMLVILSFCGLKIFVFYVDCLHNRAQLSFPNCAIVVLSCMDMIMEQNDIVWMNKRKLSWIYWLSGALLISGLILSNFYRGENISALSAPLGPQPLKTFHDLNVFNYTLLSKILPSMAEILVYELQEKQDNMYLSDQMRDFIEINLYSTSYEANVLPKKLVTREFIQRIQFDKHETYAISQGFVQNYSVIRILKECNNVGVVGWRATLESLKNELQTTKFENPLGTRTISSSIVGTEVLFRRYSGWSIKSWINPVIFQRLAGLAQSGLSDELLKIYKKKGIKKLNTGLLDSEYSDIKALGIKGNILSLFGLAGCGLACSLILFFFEVSCLRQSRILIIRPPNS